jgi:hypothetical protein
MDVLKKMILGYRERAFSKYPQETCATSWNGRVLEIRMYTSKVSGKLFLKARTTEDAKRSIQGFFKIGCKPVSEY